ncbi:MAG TPA: PQQ-binding-like beta-propeller repeat protein [Verrucomicrobiota bacterium]|nr:PQQ-binding-like beta-propeller repeat protein [Verrucomicrobiota bacterium]
MKRLLCMLMIFCLGLGCITELSAQGWMQWRGPSMNGSTTTTNLPVEWSEQTNIVWGITMPGKSGSTPIVFNTNIFAVSQGSYGRLLLLNLAMKNGTVLWEKEIGRLENWEGNSFFEKGFYSLCSPITNAKTIWALFGSGDIAAYDFAGNELWKRNLVREHGFSENRFLDASTPILFSGKLYIPVGSSDSESGADGEGAIEKPVILCLDAASGKTLWIQEWLVQVNDKLKVGPLSAILYERESKEKSQLIVSGANGIAGYSLGEGEELWRYLSKGGTSWRQGDIFPVPVPAPDIGLLFAPVFGDNSLIAIKMDSVAGPIREEDLSWKFHEESIAAVTVSPLYHKNRLYTLEGENPCSMVCRDAASGKKLWEGALSVKDPFSSSPTGADDKIYCLSDSGTVVIINAGACDREEIAVMKMGGQAFNSGIAISNQRLFIRTCEKLYCVKKRQWIRFMDNEFLD